MDTNTLSFSLLDVYVSQETGVAYILGVCSDLTTVAIRVLDYRPYFFVHDPLNDSNAESVDIWGRKLGEDKDVSETVDVSRGALLGMDVVHQKLLFGHSSKAPHLLKVYCLSTKKMKFCASKLQGKGYKTYEHDKDVRLAFLRENNLTMFGTVVVQAPATPNPKRSNQKFSRCDHELTTKLANISCTPFTTFPSLVVASYDIETTGLDADSDHVFQVSLCVRRFPFVEGEITKKTIISTLPLKCPSNEQSESKSGHDFQCVEVKSEAELVKRFVDVIVDEKVTFLCAWNNLGFDAPFLNKRAKITKCVNELQRLSFLLGSTCRLQLKEKSLDSSAFGTNHFFAYQGLHGLTEVDGLLLARKNSSLKLNSYKLNSVAKELLGSCKDDVTYDYLFSAVEARDPEMLYKVAKYCVQDSHLVLQIFEHLKDVDNMLVTSSLTNVPLSYIAERGQTVKCESLVRMEAYRQNLVWNTFKRKADGDAKYQGSTVIESKTGFYTDKVVVMDFNSLYPSIMMAYKLSPETLVGTTKDKKWTGKDEDLAFYEEGRLYVYIGSNTFAVFDSNGIEDPVIPHVLQRLIAERKAVRKEMASLGPQDKLRRAQLHAKQLALKVNANSVYGSTGFINGPLPLVEIAASTTAIGRMSIQKVRLILASQGYPNIVAGDTDSVMLLINNVTVQQAIDIANDMCTNYLNPAFPPPMRIEFEKVFYPYLILTKKRYAGLLWEDATNQPKRDIKGLCVKRRDFAPLVSKTVGEVLDIVLWKRDTSAAAEYVKTVLKQMIEGLVPYDDFVIRKELKKMPEDYATPTPHSASVARWVSRDPTTNTPRLGDRVPFVITRGHGEIVDRSEHPDFASVQTLDYLYYLDNQLKNPTLEVFKAIGHTDVLVDVTRAFNDTRSRLLCQQTKQRQITDFFQRNKQK